MPLSSVGGAPILNSAKCIRLAMKGCANRPFYHIVVMGKRRSNQSYPIIEQLGTYDPYANVHGEKLCSLNLERITYWIGAKAFVSPRMSEILGLAGYYPLPPRLYMSAWRSRAKERAALQSQQNEREEAEQ